MKKKISLLLWIPVLMLVLAGCGNVKSVKYNESDIEAACEYMLSVVANGGVTGEQISGMSEWNQGALMAQMEAQVGVKMEASVLINALEGWEASRDECGEYISHEDYQYKSDSTGVVVTTEADFSDRDAEIEFEFNEDLELESMTVSAHYTVSEILEKAGMNTLLGMGTVFVMLIFMCFVISMLKYVPAWFNKPEKRASKSSAAESAASAVPEPVQEDELDDAELIAVIAAAIAAYEGEGADGFVVRSIKRRKSNKWNA